MHRDGPRPGKDVIPRGAKPDNLLLDLCRNTSLLDHLVSQPDENPSIGLILFAVRDRVALERVIYALR